MDLHIDIEEIEKKIVLRLDGRLDASTVVILEKKLQVLETEGKTKVLLDFGQVDYMSSAGLRLLLSQTKKFHAINGSLVLFSVQEEVMEIIQLAGFEKILKICKHEQEALQIA